MKRCSIKIRRSSTSWGTRSNLSKSKCWRYKTRLAVFSMYFQQTKKSKNLLRKKQFIKIMNRDWKMRLLCKWRWRIWWRLGRICCFLRRKRVNKCTRNMCKSKKRTALWRKIKSIVSKNTEILRNRFHSFNPKMGLDCILSFRKC